MNDGQTLRFDDQYEPVFSYLNKKIIGMENSTLREHNILLDQNTFTAMNVVVLSVGPIFQNMLLLFYAIKVSCGIHLVIASSFAQLFCMCLCECPEL